MICNYCGSIINDSCVVCPQCNAVLSAGEAAPVSAPQSPEVQAQAQTPQASYPTYSAQAPQAPNFYQTPPYQGNFIAPKAATTHDKASLALGITGTALTLLCCCSPIGLILGVIGLILSFTNKEKPAGSVNTSGKILSVIAIVLSVIVMVITIFYILASPDFWEGFNNGYYS